MYVSDDEILVRLKALVGLERLSYKQLALAVHQKAIYIIVTDVRQVV